VSEEGEIGIGTNGGLQLMVDRSRSGAAGGSWGIEHARWVLRRKMVVIKAIRLAVIMLALLTVVGLAACAKAQPVQLG